MRLYRRSCITAGFMACLQLGTAAVLSAAHPNSTPARSVLPRAARSRLAANPQASGEAVDVQLDLPPEIPIRITNFRFEESPGMNPVGMMAFHYTVENTGTRPLVAFEVQWETYVRDRPGIGITNEEDRWLQEPLLPGELEQFQITNISDSVQQPIRRLTATITYAEFDDGTRLGAEVDRVFRATTERRRATVDEYTKLLRLYLDSGTDALLAALGEANSSHAASLSNRPASQVGDTLLALFREKGIEAVVAELERVLGLKLPE